MASDKMQALKGMTTRQKGMLGIFAVVVIIIIWQVMGLFSGDSAETPAVIKQPSKVISTAPPNHQKTPVQATQLPDSPVVAQSEQSPEALAEVMRLQQETQSQYLKTLNELQVLKVERDIAVINKDISAARLERVQSEKEIINLLAPTPPPAPRPTTEAASTPVIRPASVLGPVSLNAQDVKYLAVSVSRLQNSWRAVLSYNNNLYSVNTGDVLPPDGSKVISINSNGVTLQQDGKRVRISVVPTIQ
jgi:type IV pilus biogenesis protein PilP